MQTKSARMTCSISIERLTRAVQFYRASAYEPFSLREWISRFGEVYSAHFAREFCLCKDGMVRVRRLSTFGKYVDSFTE